MVWALELSGGYGRIEPSGVTLTGHFEVIFEMEWAGGSGKFCDSYSGSGRFDINIQSNGSLDSRNYCQFEIGGLSVTSVPNDGSTAFQLRVFRDATQSDQGDKNLGTLFARYSLGNRLNCQFKSITVNNGAGGTNYHWSVTDSVHDQTAGTKTIVETLQGADATFYNIFANAFYDLGGNSNEFSGSGEHSALSPVSQGIGFREVSGFGDSFSSSPTSQGSGYRGIDGLGDHLSLSATIAGQGLVGLSTIGQGAHFASSSISTGLGFRESKGTGEQESQRAIILGSGEREISGDSEVFAQDAQGSGVGSIEGPVFGIGIYSAGSALSIGVGFREISGVGFYSAGYAESSGSNRSKLNLVRKTSAEQILKIRQAIEIS